MVTVIILTLSLAFNLTHFVWFLRFRNGQNDWKERVDASVVRSVMEEDPQLAEKVVKTFNAIRGPYPYASDAMKDARRLHGLEP